MATRMTRIKRINADFGFRVAINVALNLGVLPFQDK
jgi:hypothetical protein